jgi:hypothetical protein
MFERAESPRCEPADAEADHGDQPGKKDIDHSDQLHSLIIFRITTQANAMDTE